ncbi:MAG: hypothetical protein JWQ09_6008 [Segetibacter sp.]|nr:hypothetical protein [Segetibacter sp.]
MAKKILLAHLNSNGDCLYATVIARQIKEVDYPGCHLTWAVNSKSKQSVLLNPYIDDIWEIPTLLSLTSEEEWNDFVLRAEQRKAEGDFDTIFYTQLIGKNTINFDGGIRSSTYNNYPNEITVSQQPILRLSDIEVQRVKKFAELNQLNKYTQVFLLECGPESFKSSLNPTSTLQWAEELLRTQKDLAIILSSNKKIASASPAIIDGSVLTFRENAELTKYCTLFIGCSSGISWLTTTDWAKPLPTIIITDYSSRLFTSMVYDHEFAGLPVNNIIEMRESKNVMKKLQQCVHMIVANSFDAAKTQYHQPFRIENYSFIYKVCRDSFKRMEFVDPLPILRRSIKRNGFNFMSVLNILRAYLKMPIHLIGVGIKSISKKRIRSLHNQPVRRISN